ncbi:MAG: YaaA family protein [Flavobacteriia bacterium]|nr:YaaA family protein [Flavobacteriia bacterium]
MKHLKIVLSPAKSLKLSKNDGELSNQKPHFLKESRQLHSFLKTLDAMHLQELMSISPKIAAEVMGFTKHWKKDFSYQAVSLFDGEVYRGLDVATMDANALDWMEGHLNILSGLYGVLRPFDVIAPYRLEMKTKIILDEPTTLYRFWGDKIAKYLSKESDVLVNLASEEYSKAILPYWNKEQVINPIFLEDNGDKPKMVMMYAKNARGKMARFIIDHRIENPSFIKAFDLDGYAFSAEKSQGNDWVFLR